MPNTSLRLDTTLNAEIYKQVTQDNSNCHCTYGSTRLLTRKSTGMDWQACIPGDGPPLKCDAYHEAQKSEISDCQATLVK